MSAMHYSSCRLAGHHICIVGLWTLLLPGPARRYTHHLECGAFLVRREDAPPVPRREPQQQQQQLEPSAEAPLKGLAPEAAAPGST